MLSTMVIETGRGPRRRAVFRFNGTTEWALDSVEQHEAVWIPREDQLRDAGLPWEPPTRTSSDRQRAAARGRRLLSSMVVELGRAAHRLPGAATDGRPEALTRRRTRRCRKPRRGPVREALGAAFPRRRGRTRVRRGAAHRGRGRARVAAPGRGTVRRPADGPSAGARPRGDRREGPAPPWGGPALLRSRRRSRGPPADHLARSRISTRRHRLVAEVGRVSMTRTRSPMPAVFSSSWALNLLVLVVTLP